MINSEIRNDFIGLDKKVFFDNASHSPMLKTVKEGIDTYLTQLANLTAADIESLARR